MQKINNNRFFVFILLILIIGLSSCTIIKISGRGPVPLVLNNLPTKVKVISHFKEDKVIAFDYTNSFDVSEVIAKKLAETKADAAINIVIKVQSDPGIFLINLLTLGFANARRFEIEGDLVKIEGGLSSIIQKPSDLTNIQSFKKINFVFKSLNGKIAQIPFIIKTKNGYIIVNTQHI